MSDLARDELVEILKRRFMENMHRHPGLGWEAVQARLAAADARKMHALAAMERTGGEPDVVGREDGSGALTFVDCSAESPSGRRSLCFDREALEARKQNKPEGAALESATTLGIEMLDEAQYRALQEVEAFDRKTSSWIRTPAAIRALGGALFCDCRYGAVFTYHNGAESYYAARGFRGRLVI